MAAYQPLSKGCEVITLDFLWSCKIKFTCSFAVLVQPRLSNRLNFHICINSTVFVHARLLWYTSELPFLCLLYIPCVFLLFLRLSKVYNNLTLQTAGLWVWIVILLHMLYFISFSVLFDPRGGAVQYINSILLGSNCWLVPFFSLSLSFYIYHIKAWPDCWSTKRHCSGCSSWKTRSLCFYCW